MLVTPYQFISADGTPCGGQTFWVVEHIYNTKREADIAYKSKEKDFSLIVNTNDIIVFNVNGEYHQLKVIGFTKKGLAILTKLRKA